MSQHRQLPLRAERTSVEKVDHSGHNSFNHFSMALQQFPSLVTENRGLLRKIYSIALESDRRQDRRRQAVSFVHDQARPQIELCRRSLLALKQANIQVVRAEQICNQISMDCCWAELFEAARQSIADLSAVISAKKQRVIDELPRNKRKKAETVKWELLWKRYDYDLRHLGWKASRTWFLVTLDQLLTSFFDKRKTSPSSTEYCKLIKAIFRTAFNENKSAGTVKMAIHRLRKNRRQLR